MDNKQAIRLYKRATRYQDAMVAWLIYRAACEADAYNMLRPYGMNQIRHLNANVSGWQEANAFNPAAFEAAEEEASRIIAEITAS